MTTMPPSTRQAPDAREAGPNWPFFDAIRCPQRPALSTPIDRSNYDRAVALEQPCQYLVARDPFDLLTVLLKNTLQIGRAEGLRRASQVFKRQTGHAAPDAPAPVASGEPDGLGRVRPKEARIKLNRTGHFTPTVGGRMIKGRPNSSGLQSDAWLSCAGTGESAPGIG